LGRGLEVLENLVVLESDLDLLVHVFVYVVDVLGHLGSSFVAPWEAPNPPPSARILHLARADATTERRARGQRAEGASAFPSRSRRTEEKDENPRDLWGRDAGAPRSLLSLLGSHAPPPGR